MHGAISVFLRHFGKGSPGVIGRLERESLSNGAIRFELVAFGRHILKVLKMICLWHIGGRAGIDLRHSKADHDPSLDEYEEIVNPRAASLTEDGARQSLLDPKP